MAAGTFTLYNSAKRYLQTGQIDLDTSTLKVRLYKGQAAASLSNQAISTISGLGVSNAAANCSDKTLGSISVEALNGSATQKFKSADIVFTATGGNIASALYMVMWESTNGKAIGWCKLSTTAFAVTQNNTLTVYAPTNGWFVTY